jgi:ParB-like chromosome segregation protein Spo0J
MDTRPIAALRPHPRNAAIYGDQADSELVESIRAKGVLTPLLITRAGIVISGHRRLDAARKASLAAVPVTLYGSEDELDILGALLESNKQRAKTNEQIGREYTVALEVKAAEAKKRQADQARRNQPRGQNLLNSTGSEQEGRNGHADSGNARDKAAEMIGVGWQKAERAAAVVQAADRLAEEGKTREAAQLRTALNGKSVSRAYAEAQERGYVASPPPPAPPNYGRVITLEEWSSLSAEQQDRALGLRDPKFKLNSQGTDNIEWALHSWNPVTGCKHDCSYCYARDIAVRRYPHGFVPAILPGRLAGPRNTAVPPEAAASIAHRERLHLLHGRSVRQVGAAGMDRGGVDRRAGEPPVELPVPDQVPDTAGGVQLP